MTTSRGKLLTIYDGIERRAAATAAEHAWWPCRRGCDSCCRRLADVPRMVAAEWALLEEGLDALLPDVRAQVVARIDALVAAEREGRLPRHITCPMLDEDQGACRVYAHRPAACRTYGFYVERGLGLHCGEITAAVEEAETKRGATITWGNQEGVDGALAQLSAEVPLPLTAWRSSSRGSRM